MKLSRFYGAIVVAAISLVGCDSSEDIAASRPLDSRPASSVETDVFNDVVVAQRIAPQPTAAGSVNLLTNPGFENGVGGWNNCAAGSLNVSNDASEGVQALHIEPNNCVYRSVQVDPGASYFLSCDVKLDPVQAWTGMGLVFANSDYVSLLDAPVAVATSGEYMTLMSEGTAPSGTSFVSLWIHSDFGALVDNCSLVLEADRPEVELDSGNLLDNSNFQSKDSTGELENWTSGCHGEAIPSDTNITLTNGACLDQSLNTVAIASIENSFARFGCYISNSDGYSDLSVFLDGELAASHLIQYTQDTTFVSVDLNVTTASNGFVTLYSEGTLTAESCTFDTVGSTPPDNPSEGSIAVEFESTTLEELVKERLSITEGPVTRDDMLLLTSLFGGRKGNVELDSVVGLEYATNLVDLELSNSPIESLAPLAGLTSLEFLIFPHAAIDSLAPLAELNSLEWITVATTPELSDISVFSNLAFPNLFFLEFLGSSSISDLTPLTGYDIDFLTVRNAKVTDPSPLASMSNIDELELTGSKLTTFQSLIDGPILTTNPTSVAPTLILSSEFLDLSQGSADRLELEALYEKKGEGFQILLASPSGERTPLPASEVTNGGDDSTAVEFESAILEELVKSELGITGRSVTRGDMENLTDVISNDDLGIDSLVGLEYATNLTELSLAGSPITSLEPLAAHSSLQFLQIPDAQIGSLSPLAGHTSLEFFIVGTTPEVSDLSLFENQAFPQLLFLELFGSSSISDLTPLSGYSLNSLILRNAKVTDPSPIASMAELFDLELTGAKLTNIQSLIDGEIFSAEAFGSIFTISSEFLDLSIGSADSLELTELLETKAANELEIVLVAPSGARTILRAP